MYSEGKIKLEIATPHKIITSETVAFVTLPGELGEIAILPRRAPIILSLSSGLLKIYDFEGQNEKVIKSYAISKGTANVNNDFCRIMVDFAEEWENIGKDKVLKEQKILEETEEKTELILIKEDYLNKTLNLLEQDRIQAQ